MRAKSKPTAEVAIIGAGPAGIACAVQLSRYGIETLIFEKDQPGGLLKNANLVENFPGFPEGISGARLVTKLTAQLGKTGLPMIHEEVSRIVYEDGLFKIRSDHREYSARFLVLASGTRPVLPAGLRVPRSLSGKVFTEVYPLRKIKNAEIMIIGAGDAAFDYALQLAKYNKVTIMNRSDRARCLPVLYQRAMDHPYISYHVSHSLIDLNYNIQYQRVNLSFQSNEQQPVFLTDYIIFATGRRPELSFVSSGLSGQAEDMRKSGKLYLVGDVANDRFRQASIAYGDGMKAAMEICIHEGY